ncbi:hypothetical protein KKB18_00280 [bacterium]|nr:hypothetical protein [bacterium]
MMRRISIQMILVLTLLAAPALNLFAFEDFPVNTYTDGNQSYPAVAMDGSGNYVITWKSMGQDGDSDGIFAQMFNSDGTKNGNEFQVNTYTIDSQVYPAIAMRRSGSFVITWVSYEQDGSICGIYAQMFNNDGSKKGSEFLVNTQTEDYQFRHAIAMDKTGNFIIAWSSNLQDGEAFGVYAQRFDPEGKRVGDEFKVSTEFYNNQEKPSIAFDDIGNFVITWKSDKQDGSSWGIYAQRFDNNGNPVGEEFRVNTHTDGSQEEPSAAMDSEGNFIVAWNSYSVGEQYGVYAQRFDSNGNPVGGEFQVSTFNKNPSIVMDRVGNFIITWHRDHQDGPGSGVYAQKYDNNGNPIDDEFRINTYYSLGFNPRIALCDTGDYLITWCSQNQYSQKSEGDIFARKLNFIGKPQVDIYANKNMSKDYFKPYTPGNTVKIGCKVNNPKSEEIDMYAAILLGNVLYWYPAWDGTPHPTIVETGVWNENIAELKIEEGFPGGTFPFYAAITEHDTYNLLYLDFVEITIE